jgi:hypothetical protein
LRRAGGCCPQHTRPRRARADGRPSP